jgi:hypothetical protein
MIMAAPVAWTEVNAVMEHVGSDVDVASLACRQSPDPALIVGYCRFDAIAFGGRSFRRDTIERIGPRNCSTLKPRPRHSAYGRNQHDIQYQVSVIQ